MHADTKGASQPLVGNLLDLRRNLVADADMLREDPMVDFTPLIAALVHRVRLASSHGCVGVAFGPDFGQRRVGEGQRFEEALPKIAVFRSAICKLAEVGVAAPIHSDSTTTVAVQ